VAGQWTITSDSSGWSMQLAQDGSVVSGTMANSERSASLAAKGTFTDGALTLVATGPLDGQTIEITLKGSMEAGTLKGTYAVGGNSGAWTATRTP